MKRRFTFAVAVLLTLSCLSASHAADSNWIVLSDGLKAFQPPTGEWFVASSARSIRPIKNT